jgi:hypothetical protein
MAHPSAMFAIPAAQDLGAGIVGTVERTIPNCPSWNVRLRLDANGTRSLIARWEWDLAPPVIGSRLAVVVVPGTLRFFTSSGHAVDRHPRATPRRATAIAVEPASEDDPGPSSNDAENAPSNGIENGPASGSENGSANGHLPEESIPLESPAGIEPDLRPREAPTVD